MGICKIGTKLFMAKENGICYSADNGVNWLPIPIQGINSSQLLCMASLGTNLFIGALSGFFRSQDSGKTWIPSNLDTRNPPVFSLLPYKRFLFAGTGSGSVFVSADTGKTWTEVGKRTSSKDCIYDLSANDNYLYAATYTNGILRFPLSNLLALKSSGARHNEYERFTANLQQTSKKSLSGWYTLFSPGPVKFQIIDLQGRIRFAAAQEMVSAGKHAFAHDLRNIPAGLYIIKIRAGSNYLYSGRFFIR